MSARVFEGADRVVFVVVVEFKTGGLTLFTRFVLTKPGTTLFVIVVVVLVYVTGFRSIILKLVNPDPLLLRYVRL